MSAPSPATVADCAAALCSTYHDGALILQHIKSKRKGLDITAQDLELSIARGESAVSSQYSLTYNRLGESFATGDHIARATLRDITPHIEVEINQNLKAHYESDATVDFTALQDVCDSSQDRAVLALMQLQQRLIAIGPIANATPPPLNPANAIHRSGTASSRPSVSISTAASQAPLSASSEGFRGSCQSRLPSPAPLIPPNTPFSAHPFARPGSSLSRKSAGSTSTTRRDADPYKPVAMTVTTPGIFGIGRRTKVEPVMTPPENPLIDEYLADAFESHAMRISPTASVSTVSTPILDHIPSANYSLQDYQSDTACSSPKQSESAFSFDTILQSPTFNERAMTSNLSIKPINATELLPNEMNQYAGFCKGAWRQQIGDIRRAMEDRVRPGGMYNQAKFWQCKHCKFEGRLVPLDKKRNGYDMRVFKLVEGIQFRWEFMFKSHIASKDVESNPTKATFGCIFCCSEGRGTPTFGGIQVFMDHLVDHRDQLPNGEVLYRMNCLVGRQATVSEDFDINITSLEGA